MKINKSNIDYICFTIISSIWWCPQHGTGTNIVAIIQIMHITVIFTKSSQNIYVVLYVSKQHTIVQIKVCIFYYKN